MRKPWDVVWNPLNENKMQEAFPSKQRRWTMRFQRTLSWYLLAIYAIAMTALSACLLIGYLELSARVVMAHQQTADYEYFCTMARNGSSLDGIHALETVLNLYPSGTLQTTGSQLDRMVERSRKWAASDIILQLRQKAPEDLGDDPQKWIHSLEQ
jgi:hypothetical protein